MKNLKFDTGGRPVANDDFDVLQDEVYAAIYATLQGAAPMVLSGCRMLNRVYANGITTADVEPGFVWLAGNIHRYDGAAAQTLPVEIAAGGYEDSDYRAYQTGGSKPCMYELQLVTQPHGTAAAGTAILSGTIGFERTYAKWLESRTRTIGEVQWLANVSPSQYDGTGRGWADQAAAGWGLCNGQDGRADLRQRFIVGQDPAAQDYENVGQTGGEASVTLSIAQMPNHNHNQGTKDYLFGPTDGGNNTPQVDRSAGEPNVVTPGRLQAQGGGEAHENRPPYYVLAARQWVGL